MTWCGKCYKTPQLLSFFVETPENEFGALWQRKGDESRFMSCRSEEFLMYPFQCDTCWFRNLEERISDKNSYTDVVVLAYIRHINFGGM